MTWFVSGNGATLGGITSAFTYNKRLQPVNMSASTPSQTVFSIGYDFHAGNGTAGSGTDNGNVWSIFNFRDRTRDQSFTYDQLNRLTPAQNAGTNCAASTVNGKTEYWGNSYSKLLQPVNMSASTPSQTVFSIGYDIHAGNGTAGSGTDNGNVWNIYNYRDRTRDQNFTYDQLNRLTSAQNAGTNCAASTVNGKTEYWGNSYGYDAWGNLTDKTVTKCGAENFHPGVASVTNQLPGYGYDAAGNMTSDPTDGTNSTYDAENRIAMANTPQGVFTYTYDADSNRVEKSGNGTGTLYWYMTPGIVADQT